MKSFDPGELRNAHLSAQISWQPLAADRPQSDDVPELMWCGDFSCPIPGCDHKYNTSAALACHMRKSKLPDHGVIQPLSLLTICSECMICKSRFTDK
jgi:hypothetical protein